MTDTSGIDNASEFTQNELDDYSKHGVPPTKVAAQRYHISIAASDKANATHDSLMKQFTDQLNDNLSVFPSLRTSTAPYGGQLRKSHLDTHFSRGFSSPHDKSDEIAFMKDYSGYHPENRPNYSSFPGSRMQTKETDCNQPSTMRMNPNQMDPSTSMYHIEMEGDGAMHRRQGATVPTSSLGLGNMTNERYEKFTGGQMTFGEFNDRQPYRGGGTENALFEGHDGMASGVSKGSMHSARSMTKSSKRDNDGSFHSGTSVSNEEDLAKNGVWQGMAQEDYRNNNQK